MVIQEMTRAECLQTLEATRLARLACAFENQPYVVPTYLAYHARSHEAPCLYGFTTPGQKVEWMRANPLVCIEVDEVESYDQWVSVIAFGRYEELAQPPESDCERLPARADLSQGSSARGHTTWRDDETYLAHQVLQATGMWWEPGCTAWADGTKRGSSDPFILIYYKVRIDKVTGHRATPGVHGASTTSLPPARKLRWLRSALASLWGRPSST